MTTMIVVIFKVEILEMVSGTIDFTHFAESHLEEII
jgi:hypothetical protein